MELKGISCQIFVRMSGGEIQSYFSFRSRRPQRFEWCIAFLHILETKKIKTFSTNFFKAIPFSSNFSV